MEHMQAAEMERHVHILHAFMNSIYHARDFKNRSLFSMLKVWRIGFNCFTTSYYYCGEQPFPHRGRATVCSAKLNM